MLQIMVFLAVFAIAWYVAIARPSKRHAQMHADVTADLKPGDRILTVGGIYGLVVERAGDAITIELSPGTTTEIARSAIAGVQRGSGTLPPRTRPIEAQQSELEQTPMQDQHHHGQQSSYQPQPAYTHQPMPVQQPILAQQHAPSPHPAGSPFGAAVPQHGAHSQQHTFSAQVLDHRPVTHSLPAVPSFESRPWQAAPQQYAPQQPLLAHTPQVPAPPQSLVGYAPQPTMQQQGYAPAPQPPQHVVPAPGVYAYQAQAQPQIQQPTHGIAQQEGSTRPRSTAPQGMGQAAHLDGDLLRQFERARQERGELASEYQRSVAPMVAQPTAPPQQPADQHMAPPSHVIPQLPGRVSPPQQTIDPQQGRPALFVHGTSGSQASHVRSQFPGPARPPELHGAPGGVPQPTMQSQPSPEVLPAAFQRPAPFAPDQQVTNGQFVGAAPAVS